MSTRQEAKKKKGGEARRRERERGGMPMLPPHVSAESGTRKRKEQPRFTPEVLGSNERKVVAKRQNSAHPIMLCG